ncbi:hypothetical protein Pmani_033571 [Petrolisthes manimaculis]|uniref:Uncharacterized protein n=1 Tax=Petrolisthes manimaculis TaxID=1843537 RepID=A0AAE1NRA8_9EUCA|nr:hypothetical protein Pmani_033571 [Petrolisthes manimaculis]
MQRHVRFFPGSCCWCCGPCPCEPSSLQRYQHILGFHTNWTQLKLVTGNQKLHLEEDDTHSSGHNYCIAGHPWARLQKEQGLPKE